MQRRNLYATASKQKTSTNPIATEYTRTLSEKVSPTMLTDLRKSQMIHYKLLVWSSSELQISRMIQRFKMAAGMRSLSKFV